LSAKFSGKNNSHPFLQAFLRNFSIRTALGFIISGILLWYTFYASGLQPQKLLLNFRQWLLFIAACCAFILATWVHAYRSKFFWINSTTKRSDISAYKSILIGNFYNSVLPGNLGEGVRAWHFAKTNKVGFQISMAAITAEKWIDAQLFIPGTIIFFLGSPFIPSYILLAIACCSAGAFVLTIVFGLMRKYRALEKKIWLIVLRFKKPGKILFRLYYYTTIHLQNLKKRKHLKFYFSLCATIVALSILQFYLLLNCASVSVPVAGIYTAYLVLASMMIIAFIPAAPSNIGVLNYGIYATVSLAAAQYHIKPGSQDMQSYALFSICVYMCFVLSEVSLGLWAIWSERDTIFNSHPEKNAAFN